MTRIDQIAQILLDAVARLAPEDADERFESDDDNTDEDRPEPS